MGIDALVEGNKIAAENVAGVFNGQMLIAMVTRVLGFAICIWELVERANTMKKKKEKSETFLQPSSVSMSYSTPKQQQQQFSNPFTIASMISIGIGLHNLGEGLAIGEQFY